MGRCDDAIGVAVKSYLVSRGRRPTVRFDFEDRLRADAKRTVAALKSAGCEVQMLSGDRDAPASLIAAASGIEDWQAASDPKQKVEHLEALRDEGARTLMVGDGLNDAAALALAHVSISPGTAADASQAAADMVMQGEALGADRRGDRHRARGAPAVCSRTSPLPPSTTHCRTACSNRTGDAADCRGCDVGVVVDRDAERVTVIGQRVRRWTRSLFSRLPRSR